MATNMKWADDGKVRHVKVSVSDAGVSWSYYSDGLIKNNEIKLKQLLKPRMEQGEDNSKLIVQYAKVNALKKTQIVVRCAEIVFLGSVADCDLVKSQIDASLKKNAPHRPQRVLIFINPKSGFQRGLKDYDRVVAPLMARCGVAVDDIIMKSSAHAAEVLDTYDLSSIDAVLAMGGDGTYMHVINALIRRTLMDLNADLNSEPVTPSVPFGTIPGGSGCASAVLMCGVVMDIETSVLSIVLGLTEPFDMIGTWRGSKSLGYGILLTGCGLMTNVYMWLECIKWMGRHRYWLIFPRVWWMWRTFDIEVDYLPVKVEEPKTSMEVNGRAVHDLDNASDGWKTIRCKASEVWIITHGLSGLVESFLKGSYGRGRMDTGSLSVNIVTARNILQAYRGFTNMFLQDNQSKYLERVDVKEVRIRGLEEWGDNSVGLAIFLDGERIELTGGASYEVKVHKGLLTALCLDDSIVQDAIGDQTDVTSRSK